MLSHDGTLSGQMVSGNSLIHRLDPRVKLAWALGIVLFVAFTLNPYVYLLLTVYLVAVVALCRVPISRVLSSLRGLLILYAITFALHILFTAPEGAVYARLGGVTVSRMGLVNGLLYSHRVFLFLATALALNASTSPVDLSDGLVRVLGPFRALRIPIDDLGMMLFVSLRFIPVMAEEASAIRDAQLSRGVRRGGGMFGRFRTLLPVALPLLVSSVRKAHYLALAIQSRGYESGRRRTSLRVFRLTVRDALFALASIVFLAAGPVISKVVAG